MRARLPSRRGLLVLALAVLSATLFTACSGSDDDDDGNSTAANADGLTEIRFGSVPAGETMLLVIADEKGLFEKHGVKFNWVTKAPPGTAAQYALLINGQIDVGMGTVTGVITGAAQGIPVKVVSGGAKSAEVDGKTSYAVIAKDDPSIRSFKDLEGKTVGVNSLQGNWEVTLRESIERDGGDPAKVELVAIPFAEQGAALRQGRVDAISTFQPFATAIEAEGDYKNLGDPQAAALDDPDAASTVTYMPTKFINEHPDAVKGYVDAITEAAEIANKDPELVRELTTKHTQIPAKLVNAAPVPSFTTAMSPETVSRWTELLVKYGVIPSPVDSSTVLWEGTPTS